jgi:cytochrome c-type biogenesis protein CcsB
MTFQYTFYPILISYLAAVMFFFAFLFTLREKWGKVGTYLLGAGLFFNFGYLVLRGVYGKYFPVTNLHEGMMFFAFLSVLLFFIFYSKYKIMMVGVFLSPFALALVLIASFMSRESVAVIPILQSFWLPIHVGSVFVGNALFALSFVVSMIYLIENFRLKKKIFDILGKFLPSLTMLDNINYLCIVYGFPFLTLGLITGAMWAQYAIGSYWNNDPKEIWSLITWILYAALLHCRLISGWRGRKVAIFSILAFAILIFSFIGVTYLFKGYHTFRTP